MLAKTNGDLLVAWHNCRRRLWQTKVNRYNKTGQLTQTIRFEYTEQGPNGIPSHITENNNGDIILSGPCEVVVTERGGRHRFTYKGLLGSGLEPHGICTDSLSHILVCDGRSRTIHLLDQDGQLLSHLLINFQDAGETLSLHGDIVSGKKKQLLLYFL